MHGSAVVGVGLRSSGAVAASHRVAASGTGLTLDGQPWWPTGYNAYQLATNWSVNRGCGAMVDLDRYFGSLPPRSLTRFDLFQQLAINKQTGALDFRATDAVFAAAQRHGQLVLPVLTAGDGACEDGAHKDRDWFDGGWQTTSAPGLVLRFDQWVTTAVTRWRSEPSLAGWTTVGEPEPSICGDAACGWQTRTCPSDSEQVLRRFFDSVGALITQSDPGALIWSGTLGGGQCGSEGDEFAYVSASGHIGVPEYHDYGYDGVALAGDQWNGLARRLSQMGSIDKPLVMTEIGELAGSCRTTQARATDFDTKIRGQHQAGTAGALLWAFVPDPRPAACTYDIGYDDPAAATIAQLNADFGGS